MANFDTGKDILTNVLSRAEELGIGLGDRETEAKAYIQAAYIAVVGEGFPWPWGKKEPPGILTTIAEYTTGSVSVTNGSKNITFSSAPATSRAKQKLSVDDDPVTYRIDTHTAAAAAAVLDRNYLGTTNAAAAFHVFEDEYNLASDFLRPFSRRNFLRDAHSAGTVRLVGEDEMGGLYPYAGRSSFYPRYAAMIAEKRIRIVPYPTDAKYYEYPYIFHPGVLDFTGAGAGDTPIISPAEDGIVLSFFAVANLLEDKNDDRAKDFFGAGAAKIRDMKRLGITLNRPRSWVPPNARVSTYR